MRAYQDSVISAIDGKPVYQARVYVYTTGTTQAQLYSDNGVTPLAQPVLTDGLGLYKFFVADGTYILGIANPDGANLRLFPNTEIYEDARNVSVPVGEPSISLPSAGARAGTLLGFDASGGFTPINVSAANLNTLANISPQIVTVAGQAAQIATVAANLTGAIPIGALSYSSGTNTVQLGSMTASTRIGGQYVFSGTGDIAPSGGQSIASRAWDIRLGSIAAPAGGSGAVVKVSKIENVTNLADMGGSNVDNRYNAALQGAVYSVDGSLAQPCGVFGIAQGAPSGTDVLAVGGWGTVTGGDGYAYGAYMEGKCYSATGGAHGVEARSRNMLGTVVTTVSQAASKYHGVWATISDGPGNAAFASGTADGQTWDIGFQATYGGAYRTAGFCAEGVPVGGTYTRGFLLRQYFTTGVDMLNAQFTVGAVLLPNTIGGQNGINFGGDYKMFRDQPGGLRIDCTKLGINKGSVAIPTLPVAATDLPTALTLVNAIRTALINYGLTS